MAHIPSLLYIYSHLPAFAKEAWGPEIFWLLLLLFLIQTGKIGTQKATLKSYRDYLDNQF